MTERTADGDANVGEAQKPGLLAPLRISAFRFLLSENLFSQVEQHIRRMAQAWLVLELTDSDARIGAGNGISAVPIGIFTLLGGTAVDRFNRRGILLTTRLAL